MPKDKRPPELTIWDGTAEDIDDWIDKVYGSKESKEAFTSEFVIGEVEG
ncbi:MAG: hypothetical protein ACW99G_14750 [Candidatus Thorarchaeota archaeon]